jgi:hypothetical protein
VINEFAYYASLNFQCFPPYFHVQTTHVGSMICSLHVELTLGRLKNEIVERKHHESKNLHTPQGRGRDGPSAEIQGINFIN